MTTPTTQPAAPPTVGGRLVTADARTLPLVGATLLADAGGGLARVVLDQRFHNPHVEPLSVVYSLPLPADAAVSGFAFRIGDRQIVGEIDRRAAVLRVGFEQWAKDTKDRSLIFHLRAARRQL